MRGCERTLRSQDRCQIANALKSMGYRHDAFVGVTIE
jgi:hypothetical protein